jgi:anthranilate synthase/aminodeoxychorismate synthase-like glutamine amidotransferase
VILLNDNYDSFTWNLVQRLGEIDRSLQVGRDLLVIRNDKITPDEAAALRDGKGPTRLIISPGPCTPKEAGVSADMIARFAGKIPILGVCLGHQTMADMHGMTVTRHVIPMHGKISPIRHNNQGVFRGLSSPFDATRYHSLVVIEDTIPPRKPNEDGWEVTAWTDEPIAEGTTADASSGAAVFPPTRRVVMGLRRVWSDPTQPPLEGVQFHPESFLTTEGVRLLGNFLKS